MYNSNGKTYHVQGSVNKDNMAMELNFFNQVIEIPIVNQKNQIQEQ